MTSIAFTYRNDFDPNHQQHSSSIISALNDLDKTKNVTIEGKFAFGLFQDPLSFDLRTDEGKELNRHQYGFEFNFADFSGDVKAFGGFLGDVIYGGSGNDILNNGRGADKLFGGRGDDHLRVNFTPLMVDGGSGFDNLEIQKFSHVVLGDNNFRHIERVNVEAGSKVDLSKVSEAPKSIISLSDGPHVGVSIHGSRGNDEIHAGAGHDTINGGGGNNHLFAGSGVATFVESGGRNVIYNAGLDKDFFDFSGTVPDGGKMHFSTLIVGGQVYGVASPFEGASANRFLFKGYTGEQLADQESHFLIGSSSA